jgi:hypothetical protein
VTFTINKIDGENNENDNLNDEDHSNTDLIT